MKPKFNKCTILFVLASLSVGYRNEAPTFEAERKACHNAIKDLLPKAVVDGKEVPEVVAQLKTLEAQASNLEMLAKQAAKQKELDAIPEHERFRVAFGTSASDEKDLSKFSLLEACNTANSDRRPEGLIKEMREEAARELQQSGVMANLADVAVPRIVMEHLRHRMAVRRFQNATQSATGSNLGSQFVQTDVRGDLMQFSSLLPAPALERAGAFLLRGLTGNVLIPVIAPTGAITTKTENASANAVDHATTSKSLTPKRLPVYVDVSDQLVMQSSPDVELLLWAFLQERVNLTKDLLGINGDGTGSNPMGVLGTVGIGLVAGGTNGLAPTEDHIIDLETAVANANASGNLYLTNSRARGFLKKAAVVSGYPDKIWGRDNTLNGYGTLVSNAVPNTLTKNASGAVCSAILFGDFSKVLLASWGGMMLEKSRDKTGAITGTGTLVVTEFFDSLVLQPAAIAAMQDALCG